jgi:CubicO group peptidase (beta-lactamase class C family)
VSPALTWRDGLGIFAHDPQLFTPGQHYLYSSYAVNLLQGVVRRASGMPFENYLRQRVWQPARMLSATIDDPDRIVLNRACEGRLLTPAMRKAMFTSQLDGVSAWRPDGTSALLDFRQGLLWRLHRDGAGAEVAYHCGSVRGFNACVVDLMDHDPVAAVLTNSFECCGWKDTEALAAIFRE